MAATVEIPDELYRRAKIHATETGRTLNDLVVTSLEKELEPKSQLAENRLTWATRDLRPGFERLMKSQTLADGIDSTTIISEDRSARENALL